jgi:hypothetical protein
MNIAPFNRLQAYSCERVTVAFEYGWRKFRPKDFALWFVTAGEGRKVDLEANGPRPCKAQQVAVPDFPLRAILSDASVSTAGVRNPRHEEDRRGLFR